MNRYYSLEYIHHFYLPQRISQTLLGIVITSLCEPNDFESYKSTVTPSFHIPFFLLNKKTSSARDLIYIYQHWVITMTIGRLLLSKKMICPFSSNILFTPSVPNDIRTLFKIFHPTIIASRINHVLAEFFK